MRRPEMKTQLVRAGLLDGGELFEQAAFGRTGRVENRFVGVFDVRCGERPAVVKADAWRR